MLILLIVITNRQGVFNLVIFFRPRYLQRRMTHDGYETRWESLKSLLVRHAGSNARRLRGRRSSSYNAASRPNTRSKSFTINQNKKQKKVKSRVDKPTSRRSGLLAMGSREESLFLSSMFTRAVATTSSHDAGDAGRAESVDCTSNQNDATKGEDKQNSQPSHDTDQAGSCPVGLSSSPGEAKECISKELRQDVDIEAGAMLQNNANQSKDAHEEEEGELQTSSSSDDVTSVPESVRATGTAVDHNIVVVVGEDLAQDVMNIVEERRRNRRLNQRNRSGGHRGVPRGLDMSGRVLARYLPDDSSEDLLSHVNPSSLELTPSLLLGSPQPDMKHVR